MDVPLLDLKSQYQQIRDDVLPAVQALLETQLCCNGPAVRQFEAQMAEYCGCKRAMGVASGTDALLVSLMALDVQPGHEVIVPAFTFFATAGVVRRLGATPVFVDIDPETFLIDIDQVAAAVTDKTRAVIPVHLYGQMVDMDALQAALGSADVAIVEDAAQAIGATRNGTPAGSVGATGCLSFYPTKNLGAMGDAGMVLCQDDALADKIESLRNHGQGSTYVHPWVGGNFRMDSIQAVVLAEKLKHLDAWTATRRSYAAIYNEALGDVDEVTTPTVLEGNEMVWHQHVIRADRRDDLRKHLGEQGVSSGVYYPLGLHMQECFADLGYREGDLPETERACREVLALPICEQLSGEQIRHTADQIRGFYG